MGKLNKILEKASPKLSWQERDRYKNQAFDRKKFSVFNLIFLVSAVLSLVLLAVDGLYLATFRVFWLALLIQIIGLSSILYSLWADAKERPFKVVELLRKDGIMPGICPNCKYDLSHSTPSECPECGFEVGPTH